MEMMAASRYASKVHRYFVAIGIFVNKPRLKSRIYNITHADVTSCKIKRQNYQEYHKDCLRELSGEPRLEILKVTAISFAHRLICDENDKKMNANELDFWIANGVDINKSLPIAETWEEETLIMKNTTPLCYAIRNREYNLVRLLLTHGANPNLRDYEGIHPLKWADQRRYGMLYLLLNHGLIWPTNNSGMMRRIQYIIKDYHKSLRDGWFNFLSEIKELAEPHLYLAAVREFCSDKSDEQIRRLSHRFSAATMRKFQTKFLSSEDEIVREFGLRMSKIAIE